MDNLTHTQMEGLVLRASDSGASAGTAHGALRRSYYTNDGANNPPPSPTAKWKGDAHAYEDPKKDPNRFPYLPHPYPLQRRGRGHQAPPGGFKSLIEPIQKPKFPEEDQIYSTYAEWWQAQRPPAGPINDKDGTFSTSFWPYGRRISCVASMDKEDQFYHLDKRIMKNHAYYKTRRDATSSEGFSKSQSSGNLMASQAEHFGYNRALGQSLTSQMSHSGAAFHEDRKRRGEALVWPPSNSGASGNKNMWESMKAQGASLPAEISVTSGRRADSVPSTSRSIEAIAGSSRYDPKQGLRNLGLGARTHAEWCLPQPPAYAPHR